MQDREAPAETGAWLLVQAEGGVWRAAGLLASAGDLGAAAQALRSAALPDAAAAFAAAVRDAGMAGVRRPFPCAQARPIPHGAEIGGYGDCCE